ncbi:MAG: hypothetical protein GXP47_10400 [Acidobacteria bacterium]|nr:hypothetical protein [Acidobacteriota bacterium]
MAPPYFYDALVYHLGLPWTWLVNGSFAPIPHNLFSHFPLAGATVYLLPVSLGLPGAAAGLHWLTFCMALLATWELAHALGAGRWSWIGPLCLLGCWHAVWVAGVAGVDHLVVLATAVAATALLTGDDGATGAVGAGIAIGLAGATKYTAVLPAGAILAAAAASPARRRGALKAALIGTGLASFWYLRNLITTGNPVYPLLWKLLGGTGWTATDAARWNRLVHEGVGGLRSLWHGIVMLGSAGPGLGPWLPIAALLAVLALLRGERRQSVRATAVAVALMVAGWLVTSHTTRYALPLIPLAGALAACGAERLSRGTRRVAVAGLLITAAYGLLLFAQLTLGTLRLQDLWLGRVNAEEWRHRVTINDPMPAYRAVDRLLPEDARVLVIGEGRSWGCPRPHGVSSPYDTPLIQTIIEKSGTAAGAARAIRAAGWEYLVINWGELRRLHRDFGVLDLPDPADVTAWRRLLADFTVPVWRSGDLEIRRLRSMP